MNPNLFQQYANDPAKFREDLHVECNGLVKRFGSIMDPWQRIDFAALDHSMKRCNGRTQTYKRNSRNRAYLERSRGHSKTTDLAVMVSWILAFSTRPVRGYAFAADKDQAKLLKDAIETLVRLNPWLNCILDVQKDCVINIAKRHPGSGARLDISTSDVASSFGILPDFIIADELTHWQGDGSLWHSILSSAAKKSNCLLVVISNAGFAETWQWGIREGARQDTSWYFSRLDGPQASWINEKILAEQKRMLPGLAYNRLWLNEWSAAGGDALTDEDIEAAFSDELSPMTGRCGDFHFVGGLDLGLTRDAAAFIVLAVPKGGRSGKIRLAYHKLWKPIRGQKVNLLDVEKHILQCDQALGIECIAFDPWQAEHLAQTIEADTNRRRRNARRNWFSKPFMREVPPLPNHLRAQASLTIESFQDRRFQFYECEPLKRDLHKLRVEEKSYGFRLVSPRDGDGHGDSASAFCLALLVGHEMAGKKRIILSMEKGFSDGISDDWQSSFDRRVQEFEERIAAGQKELDELYRKQTPAEEFLDALAGGRIQVLR